MDRPNDNQCDAEQLADELPRIDVTDIRRRAFIKRLAKAGTIAPAAVLLYSASANAVAAVGD